MHDNQTSKHAHIFGQDRPTAGEQRTIIVVVITAITMVVEIATGMAYGSMALLADGLHMASHAVALGITAFAYRYARKHAADPRFSFGTGKINSLAGYSGAVLLGVFALGMVAESIERFVDPVAIAVDQALFVAVMGLLVNGASVLILGRKGDHGHRHHGDDHPLDHHHASGPAHPHPHHDDHNFRSAYLHVLADALTSLFAIGALLSAKYFAQTWLDPMMGVVGAVMVARWSVGLLKESGRVLLDWQAPDHLVGKITKSLEQVPDTRVVDLHLWRIGPGRHAAIVAIETACRKPLDAYRRLLPTDLNLVHLTIEVSGKQRNPDEQPQPTCSIFETEEAPPCQL